MGFLTIFKAQKPELKRLPTGTFTVDAECRIVSSTLPRTVPEAQVKDIGHQILTIFKGRAATPICQFSELVVQYAAFKITAKAMRGGAIIFLSPKITQPAVKP